MHTEHNLSTCQTWVESTPQSGLCVFWPVFFFFFFLLPFSNRTAQYPRIRVASGLLPDTRVEAQCSVTHMYMYIHCRGRGGMRIPRNSVPVVKSLMWVQ